MVIHADNIISISWNPHHNGQILSTSKDCTVQVFHFASYNTSNFIIRTTYYEFIIFFKIWDVINKCLLHTFANHQHPALTAIWCPLSPKYVFSSGGDYTLRIWDINKYPPQEELCIKEKRMLFHLHSNLIFCRV